MNELCTDSIYKFNGFDPWIYGVSTSHDSFFQTRKSPGLGGVLLGLLLKGLRRGGVRRREFGREFRRRGGVRRRLLRRSGLRRGGVRRGGLRGGALRLRLRLRKALSWMCAILILPKKTQRPTQRNSFKLHSVP